MTEWFQEWFGEEYLHLYPHRDEADAERLVTLIRRSIPWRDGWRVLDVGCGAGRHSGALLRAGARPIGLDLSASLLGRAKEVPGLPLVRADMRLLPIREACTDLTVNLFTSFGYFATDQEHHAALDGMARTVRPGGWFVMDYLNDDQVRASLVARETVEVGGREFDITRRLADNGAYIEKTIDIPSGRRFTERVRLFSPAMLESMLAASGVGVTQRFGDYDGAPLGPGVRRCILVGRRA